MGGRALTIRTDLPAEELRRLARREKDRAAAARMQAIAGALEGLPRAEAARLAGMERQAPRDAVVRYNAQGLALSDCTTDLVQVGQRGWTERKKRRRSRWCWTGQTWRQRA